MAPRSGFEYTTLACQEVLAHYRSAVAADPLHRRGFVCVGASRWAWQNAVSASLEERLFADWLRNEVETSTAGSLDNSHQMFAGKAGGAAESPSVAWLLLPKEVSEKLEYSFVWETTGPAWILWRGVSSPSPTIIITITCHMPVGQQR